QLSASINSELISKLISSPMPLCHKFSPTKALPMRSRSCEQRRTGGKPTPVALPARCRKAFLHRETRIFSHSRRVRPFDDHPAPSASHDIAAARYAQLTVFFKTL